MPAPKRTRVGKHRPRYSISKPCDHTNDRDRLQYGEVFACEFRGPGELTAAVGLVRLIVGCVPVDPGAPF